MNPFITRELLYTAFTRPRTKLFLVVYEGLRKELPLILTHAFDNSAVEQRQTLLFGLKSSPFRPYPITLKNGRTIEVGSKIERIIVQALDEMDVQFEYDSKEFFEKHHLRPDFKLSVGGNVYFWEHLGAMNLPGYRNRWYSKLQT